MKRNVQICCDIEVLKKADAFVLARPKLSRSALIEQLLREMQTREEQYIPALKECEECGYEYSTELEECPNCKLTAANKRKVEIISTTEAQDLLQEREQNKAKAKEEEDQLIALEKANVEFRAIFEGAEETVREFLATDYAKTIMEDISINSPDLAKWLQHFKNKGIRVGFTSLRRLVNNADYFQHK